MHGHIKTFSMMPQWLYRLFDVPVGFGPFSSRCRKAAAFVTRMGHFCANLVRPRFNNFQSVMTKLPEKSVWDFGFVVVNCRVAMTLLELFMDKEKRESMGSTLLQAKRIHGFTPAARCTPLLFRPSVGVSCLELLGWRACSPAMLKEESILDS
ncbi:hypothetical protein CDL15_Pgr026182 [Punica granatum]|uniref:Uncharacterized protein n=1 Tax=Punica granatum TaxID=22663 RepID=A0A218VS31_PUNGR|nr:hypothetical protein CDL15_Pgr026182 [Punica granatum]